MADVKVLSEISGLIWKVLVAPGDKVIEEQPIALIESMKMEIPVLAPESGTVVEIKVAEGNPVGEGDLIAVLRS